MGEGVACNLDPKKFHRMTIRRPYTWLRKPYARKPAPSGLYVSARGSSQLRLSEKVVAEHK